MCDAVRVGSETESDVVHPELVGRQPVLVPVLFLAREDWKGPWALWKGSPTTKTDKQRGEADCFSYWHHAVA